MSSYKHKLEKNLVKAASKGDLQTVNHILAQKNTCQLNLNYQDKPGNTALHLAVINKHYECAFSLLEAGVSPFISNNDGFNQLHMKLFAKWMIWLKLYLWYQPDYQGVLDNQGYTALARVTSWDRQTPGIINTLQHTIEQTNKLKKANATLEQLQSASKDLQKQLHIKVAVLFKEIADYFLDECEIIKNDLQENRDFPKQCLSFIEHYRHKALQFYQQAIQEGFSQIPLKELVQVQQADYLTVLRKVADLSSHPENKQYYVSVANLCVNLSQLNLDQADAYLKQAIEIYDVNLLNIKYSENAIEQQITYYNQAAQLYQLSASKSEGKAASNYYLQALDLYKQIIELCHHAKRTDLVSAYQEQINLITQLRTTILVSNEKVQAASHCPQWLFKKRKQISPENLPNEETKLLLPKQQQSIPSFKFN